jgi:alpha-L-arabinofuranosidase
MFKPCSYYVQQMYAVYKGTNVLRMSLNKKPLAGQPGQDGLFASSVFDKNTGEVIIKIINTSRQPQPVSVKLVGMKGTRTAETITLSHNGMDDENTLDNPEKITPKNGTISVDAGKDATLLTDDIPAMTFRLYKIKK